MYKPIQKNIQTFHKIDESLQNNASQEKKQKYTQFFKTEKGQYGEGDLFIGVTVPIQHKIVKQYLKDTTFEDIEALLYSPYHEHRHVGALLLVGKFQKEKKKELQKELVDFYLLHRNRINNWDIVDNSAYKILGKYAFENDTPEILRNLSQEENLWSKRIAIVGTMYHVKKGSFDLMEEIALKNLEHPHDLMHKANGWLLREMGNKDKERLIVFLKKHYKKIPRTTLRYAIEKFAPEVRKKILQGIFE